MKQQLTLENNALLLIEEGDNVRVKSSLQNVLIASQTIESAVLIIGENFRKVGSFYLARAKEDPGTTLDPDEIHSFSLSIVLYYFHMYNSWRLQYKAKKYQDLTFKEDDFENPSTHDIIFRYYRDKYPGDWEAKCSILLAMELDSLQKYYERRLQYYNK